MITNISIPKTQVLTDLSSSAVDLYNNLLRRRIWLVPPDNTLPPSVAHNTVRAAAAAFYSDQIEERDPSRFWPLAWNSDDITVTGREVRLAGDVTLPVPDVLVVGIVTSITVRQDWETQEFSAHVSWKPIPATGPGEQAQAAVGWRVPESVRWLRSHDPFV